ncbi:hypothetical protein RhiirC2_733155 [Rhizophagus irregularis]|uniref:Uncharacterized protein n=1 Tax=Rhizophagus irregularis TaxID=588596 RepID=A0A2N1NSM2_9GLOM|nr:hypothetical protein RhiirC2_733155 [Rhizophagus irregularis]
MGRSMLMKSVGQPVQIVKPSAAINCLSDEEIMQRRIIGLFIAKENINGDDKGFRKRWDQNIEMHINILAKMTNIGTIKTKTLLNPCTAKEIMKIGGKRLIAQSIKAKINKYCCRFCFGCLSKYCDNSALNPSICFGTVTLIETHMRKKLKSSIAQLPTQDRIVIMGVGCLISLNR